MHSKRSADVELSVVVPTCERNDNLARCLDQLAPHRQAAGGLQYEVIVSDDARGCTAQEMVRGEYPWARWVAGPARGPAANRNNGARWAAGDWLAFVDDDCLPDRGWIASIARAASRDGLSVIEGRTVCPDKKDDPFQEAVENLDGGALLSCNFAIRREVFDRLGGFDEDFTEAYYEDIELHARIRRGGFRIDFCPEVLVQHPARRIGFGTHIRRTRQLHWTVLYRLKIGATGSLTLETLANLLRITLRPRDWHATRRRRQLFTVCWSWLSLPVVLPYLLVWQRRYRRQLA